MALALARLGVDHVVVTRYETLAAEPRAHITNQRTMEVLRDLGVSAQVEALSTPQDQIGTTTFCTSRAGEELGAGMIVVGSRGLGGVRRALMGSVSDSVVRHAHCPVLVVRDRRPGENKRIGPSPGLRG